MGKSKLGLSINLFAAILFFIGATGNGVLILAIAAGYVLLAETNERLRKTAIKALVLSIIFSVAILLLSFLGSGVASIVQIFARNSDNYYLANNVSSAAYSLQSFMRVIEAVVFVVLGFITLLNKEN